jgi:exopolyphosphatase/guanosine-5'-triphosphate,3'-diphosphate pyrophosphatase
MSVASPVIAAIDVGTNSVLLTIARVTAGDLVVVDQRATVTRLGQGVDQTGRLHPDAQARTLACLREYRTIMDTQGVEHGRAVGTSALRDAQGGAQFLAQSSQILGFPLEVVSGQTEALLTFNGALLGLDVHERACVFDIGGGSTELILGDADTGKIESSISLDVGSVRLTERLALSDPPSAAQVAALRATIAEQLAKFDLSRARGAMLVGVAGTVTTLAAVLLQMDHYDAERIHGAHMSARDLADLTARILALSVQERLQLSGLTPGRADVIGAGALLCSMIVEQAQASGLVVSDRGVRFGLLHALRRELRG